MSYRTGASSQNRTDTSTLEKSKATTTSYSRYINNYIIRLKNGNQNSFFFDFI